MSTDTTEIAQGFWIVVGDDAYMLDMSTDSMQIMQGLSGTQPPSTHRWIKCGGCEGEIGLPSESQQMTSVKCPGCGKEIPLAGAILFRPKTRNESVANPLPPTGVSKHVPSFWEDESSHLTPQSKSSEETSERILAARVAFDQAKDALSISKVTSERILALEDKAQSSLILGTLSIVLGWTFIVPLIGCAMYYEAWSVASKHNRPIPPKATVGIILTILFGGFQMLAVLSRLK